MSPASRSSTRQKHTFVASPQAQRMEALSGTAQTVLEPCKGCDTSSRQRPADRAAGNALSLGSHGISRQLSNTPNPQASHPSHKSGLLGAETVLKAPQ